MASMSELAELVYHGQEERNLEYKGPLDWSDSETKAKIVRTILGMGNTRDGGAIAIGVADDGTPVGLSVEQYASFDQDGVLSKANEYVDPYVELTVSKVTDEEKRFVVIQVKEFGELPLICRKSHSNILRQGAIYTRPRRKHETAAVPSQAEMRELIEAAVEKGIRALSGRISRAGLKVVEPEEEDKARFDEQLNELKP